VLYSLLRWKGKTEAAADNPLRAEERTNRLNSRIACQQSNPGHIGGPREPNVAPILFPLMQRLCVLQGFIPELAKPETPEQLQGKTRTLFGNIQQIYDWHKTWVQVFHVNISEIKSNKPKKREDGSLNLDCCIYCELLHVDLPLGNFVTSWLSGLRQLRQSQWDFEVVGSSLGTFIFSVFFLFLCHNFGFNPLHFTHNLFFTALSYENKAVTTWIQRNFPFVFAVNSSKNWKNVKMLPKSWLPVSWHQ